MVVRNIPNRRQSDPGLACRELDNDSTACGALIQGLALPDRGLDDPKVQARGQQALADL